MTAPRAWLAILALCASGAAAQGEALAATVRITEGTVDPFRIALPEFLMVRSEGTAFPELLVRSEGSGAETRQVLRLPDVVRSDLTSSGLFKAIDDEAFLEKVTDFGVRPRFENWRVIGAEWLVTGEAEIVADGRLAARFRLWNVPSGRQATGLQLFGPPASWRRMAHQVADAIYSEITGESGYFDSRIVFVEETGSKDRRRKRLALMDQDGANVRYLTGTGALSMTPRFSPLRQEIAYISFSDGRAQVYVADLHSGKSEFLGVFSGTSFAPRFAPDGRRMAMSIEENGNTDIYVLDLATGEKVRLTAHGAIDTAPSFSPDGRRIAFESDRGKGRKHIYVMDADRSAAEVRCDAGWTTGGCGIRRISDAGGAGKGGYGTPVWSPRGDYVAFTKQADGRFEIGVMTPEGTSERLLASGFHNEGPTWSPNGRVLMFFREFPSQDRLPALYSVDVSGAFAPREIRTPTGASDPAWSPLLD